MKLRLLPLFILIITLVFCGGCKWTPDLLSGRIPQAQQIATTIPYYVQDVQGNTIRNYQVNKAAWAADLFTKTGNGRMVYADSSVIAYSGIDVSSHNGVVDWKYAVASSSEDWTFAQFALSSSWQKGYMVCRFAIPIV